MVVRKRARDLPRVLVFAGHDPSGRAGLLADGEAIEALGAEPVLAATGIAAQSEKRLVGLFPVAPGAIATQVAAALEDGPIAAVKIGMLGSRATLEAVLQALYGPLARIPVVYDPVLETTRGGKLFDGDAEDLMPLLSRATVVTPNLDEAAVFSGTKVQDESQMYEVASRIALQGNCAVLLKGGHLGGDPSDLLLAGGRALWLRDERIPSRKRGTGCRLAAAVAAGLATGKSLEESAAAARRYVRSFLAGLPSAPVEQKQ